MRLGGPGALHLTYCTNVHPGESWAEVRANVATHALAVKARIAPDRPFGIGLRLSAAAAEALAVPDELAAFAEFLAEHQLYVFTLNGFPYGTFHGAAVKEQVYRPDWREDERVTYSDRLAHILAALLPPDVDGSISTVPGAFKARVRSAADVDVIAGRVAAHVATLHRLRERTGKTIALALEPEPCCHLETIAETVAFFEEHVWHRRVPGLDARESEDALRRHLGVCFDACHMAVEHEPPGDALATLAAHGIAVVKLQVSAGLVATVHDADDLDALRAFADDVYLHQVVERSGARMVRYLDLPAALAAAAREPRRRDWRIHFHVPLFREQLGRFASTQPDLRELLALVRTAPPTRHLEVETYTWDVLPVEYRRESIDEAIARELAWVVGELSRGTGPP
jgi:sugar phosphate isomerase/epimerase